MSSDDRYAQIVDLNEGRIYDLDIRDKTYEVTTFEELRARMEELRERAREQAPPEAPSNQGDQDDQPDREVEIDLDVQRPGDHREINGHEAELVVTTVTVREKDRTLEEAGGIVTTTHSWTSKDLTGMQEVLDFQWRYAEALGEIFGFDTSAEQMTSEMAMFPGLGEAMKRFQEEGLQVEGTAMLTEMTFESVKSEAQLAAAAPKEEPRLTIFESTTELLNIETNPNTSLVAIPADFQGGVVAGLKGIVSGFRGRLRGRNEFTVGVALSDCEPADRPQEGATCYAP